VYVTRSPTPPASVRGAFVGVFEPALYQYLVQFANTITSLDYDVLVFTARKAACLYQALQETGLVASRATVTSDRVFDMDTAWLRGKRVAVVDDLIITGSSLRRATAMLRAAGAEAADVYALAVNEQWWVPELVQPSPPYLALDNNTTLSFCTQIVQGFSVIPRPYNIDWPILDSIDLPGTPAHVLGGMPGWHAVDCTSALQHRNGVSAITLEAEESVARRLGGLTLLPTQSVRLMKARVYSRPKPGDPGRQLLRAVPIITLDDVTLDDLNECFGASSSLGAAVHLFNTPEAKLRLVQFALSAALGALWFDDLSANTGTPDRFRIDDGQIGMAFSPPTVDLVMRVLRDPTLLTYPRAAATSPRSVLELDARDATTLANTPDRVQRELTKPFLDLYFSRELPAREAYKSLKESAESDPRTREVVKRLDYGLGLNALQDIALRATDDPEVASRLVSRFLDIGIDAGAVVPITEVISGVVRRAYRHGEDIVYTQSGIRLFSRMLEAAAEARSPTAEGTEKWLPRLDVEKLSVIFLRAALDARFFEPWTGQLGNARALGVRFHLRGALIQQNVDSLYGANLGQGITDILCDSSFLTRHRQGYLVGTAEDLGPLQPSEQSFAQEFGLLWGRLRSADKARRLLPDEDMILFATCNNIFNTCAALAAEIAIARRGWAALALTVARGIESGSKDLLDHLRQHDINEALTSGLRKYEAFAGDEATTIFDRIDAQLASPMERALWQKYKPPAAGRNEGSSPSMRGLLEREARWLLAANSMLQVLLASATHAHGPRRARSVEKHLVRAVDLAKRNREKSDTATALPIALGALEALRGGALDTHATATQAVALLTQLTTWADTILAEGRACSGAFGQAKSIQEFDSALFVSVHGMPEDEAEFGVLMNSLAAKSRGRAQRREGQAGIDAARLEDCPPGWLLVGRGPRGPLRLAELAKEAAQTAPPSVGVRAHLLLNLRDRDKVFRDSDRPGTHQSGGLVELLGSFPGLKDLSRRSVWVTDFDASGPTRGHEQVTRHLESKLGGPPMRRGTNGRNEDGVRTTVYSAAFHDAHPRQSSSEPIEVGVISVIDEEIWAIREWLNRLPGFSRYKNNSIFYYRGLLETDAAPLRVTATQAVEQGDVSTTLACMRLAQHCNPRMIVLLGTAGGIAADEKDGRVGDVVIANAYLDYGHVALSETGVQHRGESMKIPLASRSAINDFFGGHGGPFEMPASEEAQSLGKKSFRVLTAPIATGPAVVKFKEAAVRRWIHRFNDKVAVVETEARGVGQAFYEYADQLATSYLIVRGISDHADDEKNDVWKRASSRHAVRVLESLMREEPEVFVGQIT
jgi:nucleoside phosphorylase